MEAELAATVAIIRDIAIEKSSAQKGAAFSNLPLMKRSRTFKEKWDFYLSVKLFQGLRLLREIQTQLMTY